MTVAEISLVPPGRLAALLITRRCEHGLDVVELSRRSAGMFSPSFLDAAERGVARIDDDTVRALLDLYELEAGPLIPHRSRLVLDLSQGKVAAGATELLLPTTTERDVLERYISLLYLLRDEKPGTRLPLRNDDLEVLEYSLSLGHQELAEHLFAIMGAHSTEQRTSLLRKRVMMMSAGLLVGVSGMGALVIVNTGDGSTPVDSSNQAQTELASGALGTQVEELRAPITRFKVKAAGATARVDAGAEHTGHAQELGRAVVSGPRDNALVEATAISPAAAAAEALLESVIGVRDSNLLKAVLGDRDGDRMTGRSAAAASKSSLTPATPASVSTPAQIGAAAEALVSYDFRAALPGWTIEYRGSNSHYQGLTDSRKKVVSVYIDAGASPRDVAKVLMHEVGHAIDVEYLDGGTRAQWAEMRNIRTSWWAGSGLTDSSVGAGDFAEAIAAATAGPAHRTIFGEFTAEQLAFVRAQLP